MASLLHYLDDIKSIENYYQFVDHGTWLEIPEKYLDQILNDFWVYLSHKEFYDKWKDELEMFDNTFEESEYEAEYTIMDTYHIKFKDGSEWFLDFMGREDPSGATDYNGDWDSKAGRFNRDWEQMNWNTDDLDKLIEMHNREIVDYRELSPEEIKEIKSNTRITERRNIMGQRKKNLLAERNDFSSLKDDSWWENVPSSDYIEDVIEYWATMKRKWNKGEIDLTKDEIDALKTVQIKVDKFFPEFNYKLEGTNWGENSITEIAKQINSLSSKEYDMLIQQLNENIIDTLRNRNESDLWKEFVSLLTPKLNEKGIKFTYYNSDYERVKEAWIYAEGRVAIDGFDHIEIHEIDDKGSSITFSSAIDAVDYFMSLFV